MQARKLADGVSSGHRQLPLLMLPSNDRLLVELGDERKNAFLKRLDRLFHEVRVADMPEAPADADADASPADASNSLFGNACAACGGHCCTGGGDHAHLDIDSMNRIQRTMTWTDAEETREAYRSLFPATHFQN